MSRSRPVPRASAIGWASSCVAAARSRSWTERIGFPQAARADADDHAAAPYAPMGLPQPVAYADGSL